MQTNRKEALTDELLSWPGVTNQLHRFGGIEFLFQSGWLSIYLKSEEDVVNAVEILRTKYEVMDKGRK